MAHYIEKKDDDGTLLGVVVGVVLVVLVAFLVWNTDRRDDSPAPLRETVRAELPDVNVSVDAPQAPQAAAPAPEAATN